MSRRKEKNQIPLSQNERLISMYVSKSFDDIKKLRKKLGRLQGCISSKKKESFLQLEEICNSLNRDLYIFSHNVSKAIEMTDEHYNKHKGYIVEDE